MDHLLTVTRHERDVLAQSQSGDPEFYRVVRDLVRQWDAHAQTAREMIVRADRWERRPDVLGT